MTLLRRSIGVLSGTRTRIVARARRVLRNRCLNGLADPAPAPLRLTLVELSETSSELEEGEPGNGIGRGKSQDAQVALADEKEASLRIGQLDLNRFVPLGTADLQ